MREIFVTQECNDFINSQSVRVKKKIHQLIEVMREVPYVHSNFVKKLSKTKFYELRIKAGNEVRVIMFALDNDNFQISKKVVLLNGFVKKSTKDYKPAIRRAIDLLSEYIDEE